MFSPVKQRHKLTESLSHALANKYHNFAPLEFLSSCGSDSHTTALSDRHSAITASMQSVTANTHGILTLHHWQIHPTAAEQGEKMARRAAAAQSRGFDGFTIDNTFSLQFSGFDFMDFFNDGDIFAALQQKMVDLVWVGYFLSRVHRHWWRI